MHCCILSFAAIISFVFNLVIMFEVGFKARPDWGIWKLLFTCSTVNDTVMCVDK